MADVLTTDRQPIGDRGLLTELHASLDVFLAELFEREEQRWSQVDRALVEPLDLLRSFVVAGGKRIRPSFCFLGHLGAGGARDDGRLIELAAALELLHAFALIHDDVMDGSAVRRHAPSVHEQLGGLHRAHGWCGEARRFGEGTAVLVGDLAFVYSVQCTSGLPFAVRSVLDEMRIELHMGQFLDLRSAATRTSDDARTRAIIRYKSSAYSVQRPMQLGVLLANGTSSDIDRALDAFALAVGEAFQLRDDLLGALGDPLVTGKPRGDDFREGKQTALVLAAAAWARTHDDADGQLALARLGTSSLGDDDLAALEDLLDRSGAIDAIESRITSLMEEADAALERLPFPSDVATALGALAAQCAWRST